MASTKTETGKQRLVHVWLHPMGLESPRVATTRSQLYGHGFLCIERRKLPASATQNNSGYFQVCGQLSIN